MNSPVSNVGSIKKKYCMGQKRTPKKSISCIPSLGGQFSVQYKGMCSFIHWGQYFQELIGIFLPDLESLIVPIWTLGFFILWVQLDRASLKPEGKKTKHTTETQVGNTQYQGV